MLLILMAVGISAYSIDISENGIALKLERNYCHWENISLSFSGETFYTISGTYPGLYDTVDLTFK